MDNFMYEIDKSNLKGAKDIKGYFDSFNSDEDKISDYKLLFILSNGKVLFMPYSPKDKRDRKQYKYAHIVYLTNALELILKELNIDKKTFIKQKIKRFDIDAISAAILELNIPFFYETGFKDIDGKDIDDYYRYTIFEKSPKFTEKQEKVLTQLKKVLDDEHYKIAIQTLKEDKNIDWNFEGIEEVITDMAAGPFGSNLKVSCFVGSGFPIIDGANLKGYEVTDNLTKFVTEEKARSLSRSIAKRNDVVVTISGTLGQIAYIPFDSQYEEYLCSQRQFRVSFDTDRVYVPYLVFYFHTYEGQQKILSFANQTGVPALSQPLKNFKRIEMNLPDLDTQKRIASVIETINAKEEENNKINENLAEQAQGVLNHFMDQYQYQLNPLSDIAVVIDCLHSKKPSAIDDSTYQLIQLDNIRDDGFLDLSACRYMISQADYENWTRKCEIIEGDCVITNVGRIGAVSQAPYGTRAAMGRNMTCIRLKSDLQLQAYFITVLLSNHMRRQIQYNTDEGTIMGALNVKNIPKLLFPIFGASVMSDLESILYPLRKQIEYNNIQNQTLAQLRDALLPRLMSGELDVSNIDL